MVLTGRFSRAERGGGGLVIRRERFEPGVEPRTAEPSGSLHVYPVGPPIYLVFIGLASALLSLGLLTQTGRLQHLLGYVLGAFAGSALLVVFRRSDLKRRRNVFYSPRRTVNKAMVASALAGLFFGAIHAYYFALLVA